jgi:hypothetical protein
LPSDEELEKNGAAGLRNNIHIITGVLINVLIMTFCLEDFRNKKMS